MRIAGRLACTFLLLTCADSRASDEWTRDAGWTESQVRRQHEILRQPPRWSERSAAIRFASRAITSNPEPKLVAIRALGDLESPSASAALIEVVEDPDSPYRVRAVTELNRSFDSQAPEALIEVLDDPDPELRRSAARVLGAIGGGELALDPSVIRAAERALARLLKEGSDPRVWVAALDGLVALGTEMAMYSSFTIAEQDKSDFVRCALVRRSPDFLTRPRGERITPRRVRLFLRKVLENTSKAPSPGLWTRARRESQNYSPLNLRSDCLDIHETALSVLSLVEDPAVLPALHRAASADAPSRRAIAVRGLARFGSNDKALDAVIAALTDPTSGVRLAAVEGLGDSTTPRADRHLIETLRAGAPADRVRAAKALRGSFGASEALIEAFGDRVVQVRDQSEVALLRSDEVVTKLDETYTRISSEADSGKGERRRKGRLRRIDDARKRWRAELRAAEQSIDLGLSSPDPRVRIRSARVLAKFESEESLSLLLDSLRSGAEPRSAMAALSLGLRGDERAREALEEAALSVDSALSIAAIRALSDLGRPESIPLLRSLEAQGEDDAVRSTARHALAILELESATR